MKHGKNAQGFKAGKSSQKALSLSRIFSKKVVKSFLLGKFTKNTAHKNRFFKASLQKTEKTVIMYALKILL